MAALQILAISSMVRMLEAQVNDQPIIGIVAQELLPRSKKLYPTSSSFIAASYLKAIESSGARVVPIFINGNESYYRHLLNSINGVVLPGGSAPHGPGHPYYDAVTKIYGIATELNKKNTIFPILSVCLGFEFFITVANNHKSFLTKCLVDYEHLPLIFTRPHSQTALFADADEKILRILNSTNVTVNHHKWCALETSFKNSSLNDDWLITSLSTSARNGVKFIATIEHKSLPFFGVQFHPEKNAFEWNKANNFPHSREAVIVGRHFFDTFVKFSRENFNTFETEEEEERSLIYNYQATRGGSLYEQMYLF